MLTLTERKALHEHNSGLGQIGKQRHRSSLGATVSAPPRAAGPHDGDAFLPFGTELLDAPVPQADHADTRTGMQAIVWFGLFAMVATVVCLLVFGGK